MSTIQELEHQHDMGLYPKRPIALVRGEGARVWDEHGRMYVDCVSGNGVANIGHANPVITEALCRQAQRLVTCPGIFYNDVRAAFMAKLVNIASPSLNRVFLCNSGAESVEAAIKFARYTTGKPEIICARHGFHGRTLGALSATHNPAYHRGFEPLVPGFIHVPFNDLEALQQRISARTAAVLLEVVQGEGGVHVGDGDYLRGVQQVCRENGVLFIIDEVQTGFCRTGRMFACQHFDLEPDMLCLAKAIAGGVPMGAVLCKENIHLSPGIHGSTFGGNPLACAAGLAAIDFMITNDLARQAQEKGDYLVTRLRQQHFRVVRDIRHLGLMVGIELRKRVTPYIKSLLAEGVLALPAGKTVLRLLPPLVITHEELDMVIDALTKSLSTNFTN